MSRQDGHRERVQLSTQGPLRVRPALWSGCSHVCCHGDGISVAPGTGVTGGERGKAWLCSRMLKVFYVFCLVVSLWLNPLPQ